MIRLRTLQRAADALQYAALVLVLVLVFGIAIGIVWAAL